VIRNAVMAAHEANRRGVSKTTAELEDGEVIGGGLGGNGITKISTTLENPVLLNPPPKNILFVDDVDASIAQG